MASPNLPESVTGLDGAAHRSHHETIHGHENDFDYDALAAAADGKIIKKVDGLWAAGDDLNSGASGFTDIGHRYVDYQNGVDTNNGLSPSTAMKTIQAANDDLDRSGVPRGGTIWLAEGQHIAVNVNITVDGLRIIGAGVWATELLMDTTGYTDDCLRFHNESCYLSDLRITDRSNRVTPVGEGRYAIWVDGGQESVFERIFIDGWADNYAGTQGFDDSPTCIFVQGINAFGDWLRFEHIRVRNANSGLKFTSGTNGWVNHVIAGGERESCWVKRRDQVVGNACSWRFFECHWLGGGGGASDFSVRCDSDIANKAGRVRFTSCHLEISTATGDTNGYYSELTDTLMLGGHLGVANMSTGKKAIHIGSGASDSVVGPYTADGLSLPGDFQDDHGIAWWQPSDYSGSY